ncbi:hypothetical protein [Cupriavidus sp. IDO]|uniref:hypothetical protein n=1 Tax=Cupriavidus sp. IDO TaxID=1539142 RepID=UPI000ADCB3EC|nr:hypothetical protein [Cupriavidus sp. IDO]
MHPVALRQSAHPRAGLVPGRAFDIARMFPTIACGAMLPYKTTRHFFDPRLPDMSIPLA